jgi:hypothetical protein
VREGEDGEGEGGTGRTPEGNQCLRHPGFNFQAEKDGEETVGVRGEEGCKKRRGQRGKSWSKRRGRQRRETEKGRKR